MTDTRLRALMFNAVAKALGDGWWLPLSQRQAVADALLGIVEPELEQLRRCVPLICSDERHRAKVTALEGAPDRARTELDTLRRIVAQHITACTELGHRASAGAAGIALAEQLDIEDVDLSAELAAAAEGSS